MIAQPFSDSVRVSQRSPGAMAALVRIDWGPGQAGNLEREANLTRRQDEWGRTVIGVEPCELERLKRELKMAILAGDWRNPVSNIEPAKV